MRCLLLWSLAALGAGLAAAEMSPATHSHALHVAVHVLWAGDAAETGGAAETQATASVPTAFARVVADGESCETSVDEVPMCASRDYVCRMEVGKEMAAYPPSCLPYEPDKMRDDPFAEEAMSAAPWDFCDPQTADAQPICQREFECQCWKASTACQCVPPDIVPDDKREAEGTDGALKCGDSGGDCAEGDYCRFTVSGQRQCGPKPYFS